MKLYPGNFSKFAPEILERGKDYFKNGKVRIVLNTNNHVHASVEGSKGEKYKVHIVLDGAKNIIDMDCSCPYKHECKHEAAVLFALENSEIKELEEKVKGIEEGAYQRIMDTISSAFQRKSLDGLRRAKEELISLRGKLSPEELDNLTSLYACTCYKAFYYGGDGSVNLCFKEAIDNLHYDEEHLADFVVRTISSSEGLSAYSLGEVFNAFLMEEGYSYAAQIGFMKIYDENKNLAISLLNSSAVKAPSGDLPIFPPYAVALIDNVPLSSSPLFYRKALEEALKLKDLGSITRLIKYLNKNHNQKYIPEETYVYLIKRGHEEEAESLLLDAFYEFDSDFDSYLRLRKFVSEARFKELAPRLSPILASKPFLNAVLLRDGSLFPEHMRSLSIKKLSCKEVYLCRDDIDEETKDKVVALIKKKLSDPKAKTREATDDLFYGLLYLDYCHDFSLDTAMFEPLILKSVSYSNEYHSIWLSIVERNNMHSKAGVYPHEVKHVSH
ncbi:MAG: hypothetical protein K6F36_04005 [Bacilli bacterium]|nr:hypothetical protein [Bacilli bacterium]